MSNADKFADRFHDTVKPINWKDWLLFIVFGLLFAGNAGTGKPFVAPNSPEALGFDFFSAVVWILFFWSLFTLVKKARARKEAQR